MAYFLFTKAILAGEPIKLFNFGHHLRDITYIDDIVDGVVAITGAKARADSSSNSQAPVADSSVTPYRLYNIGKGKPDTLRDMVVAIEHRVGKKATKQKLPLQPGDMLETWADCTALEKDFGYTPSTTLDIGIERFVDWYRDYYQV